MKAYHATALASLMLVATTSDAFAVDAETSPTQATRRDTEQPTQTLHMGQLFGRLLGHPAANPARRADREAAEADAPATTAAEGSGGAPASPPEPRRAATATTPEIDLETPRFRVPGRESTAVLRTPAMPAEQTAVELDESVASPPPPRSIASETAPPSVRAAISIVKPRSTPPAEITLKPTAPPAITARPAPTPAAEPTPAAQESAPGVAAPTPAGAARTPVAATSPPAVPRRPSISPYLTDHARFGPLTRKPQETARPIEPSVATPYVSRPSLSMPASVGSRLNVVPPSLAASLITAEDLVPRGPFVPFASVTAVAWHGSDQELVPVSQSASPRQLLQAVHYYGAPLAPPALTPVALDAASLPSSPTPPTPQPRDAQHSVLPGPTQQPTLAEPTASGSGGTLRQTETAVSTTQTRRIARGKVLHGQITRVHAGEGYATVKFREGNPVPGSLASVYRRHLFQRRHLGEVEIFINASGQLCARPQGLLKPGELASQDELVLLPQIVTTKRATTSESAPQL